MNPAKSHTWLESCSRGEREWLLDFGNGNGNGKFRSQISGTGMWVENSIPNFGNMNASGKFHSRLSGTGIPGNFQENFIPIFGNGNENGKFHSHFLEQEGDWQIPFPTFGTGIGGRYCREFPGTGIPAQPWAVDLTFTSFLQCVICKLWRKMSGLPVWWHSDMSRWGWGRTLLLEHRPRWQPGNLWFWFSKTFSPDFF